MNPAASKLPTRIDTQRVYLRFYRYSDSSWYFEMAQRNKAHLLRFEPGNAVFCIHDEEEAEAMMDHFEDIGRKRKEFYLGVFLKDNDQFVGQVFIGFANPGPGLMSCSLGFFADVSQEGKGYLTEAVQAVLHFLFNEIGADMVELKCDVANSRSARLAERCGFTKETTRSKASDPSVLHFALRREQSQNLITRVPRYQYC